MARAMTGQTNETPMDTQREAVLVTGGAGYIGSHAVFALLDAGYRVAVLDDLSSGFRFAVSEAAHFYEGDVADAALLERIFAEQGIGEGKGAVMHFAGSVVVPESVENPLKYYHNNTAKSRALIEAMVRHQVPRLIFSSTAATYGVPESSPVDEQSPCRPINPYGWSKLMTEQMIADAARAHELSYAVLRYFNVAGADPELRTGQSSIGATHLIKVAVEAALGQRDRVRVFGSDYATRDGTGERDYIHVSDLADAHVRALRALEHDPSSRMTLNCGYGHGATVLEVLDAVERVAKVAIAREMAPRRPGDPDSLVCDSRAIRERLGWRPRFDDLDRIVADALAWERKLAQIRSRA